MDWIDQVLNRVQGLLVLNTKIDNWGFYKANTFLTIRMILRPQRGLCSMDLLIYVIIYCDSDLAQSKLF
jgi:hypothetical protein